MKNELISKMYEGQEVIFRNNEVTFQPEVRINEVAKFCGWSYKKADRVGKEFIRWNTVNGFLKEIGVSQDVATGDFIPEYIMYPLIGKASNERATQFMLWVGKVLVEIRQHGAYIGENADEEYVNNEIIFGTAQRVKKTFFNSKNIFTDYEKFTEYSRKKLNTKERNVRLNQIIDTLKDREDNLYIEKPKGFRAERENIIELKEEILRDINELNNRSYGVKLGYANKKIADGLTEQVH